MTVPPLVLWGAGAAGQPTPPAPTQSTAAVDLARVTPWAVEHAQRVLDVQAAIERVTGMTIDDIIEVQAAHGVSVEDIRDILRIPGTVYGSPYPRRAHIDHLTQRGFSDRTAWNTARAWSRISYERGLLSGAEAVDG